MIPLHSHSYDITKSNLYEYDLGAIEHVRMTHRDLAFCAYTVLPESEDVFVVEDASLDDRFQNNDLVLGPPFIRFYAGAALMIDDTKIGSLCVIDTKPRLGFDSFHRMNLLDLGMAVSNVINDRRNAVVNNDKQVCYTFYICDCNLYRFILFKSFKCTLLDGQDDE